MSDAGEDGAIGRVSESIPESIVYRAKGLRKGKVNSSHNS